MVTSSIKDELSRLARKHGRLLPETVVEEARSKDSPLHDSFQWDDSAAAHQWRLVQARQIIRAAVRYIEVPGANEITFIKVREYTSLSDDRKLKGGYRVTVNILEDADLRARMLEDALREMLAFKKKYAALSELSAVFAAIDQAVIDVEIEENDNGSMSAPASP